MFEAVGKCLAETDFLEVLDPGFGLEPVFGIGPSNHAIWFCNISSFATC